MAYTNGFYKVWLENGTPSIASFEEEFGCFRLHGNIQYFTADCFSKIGERIDVGVQGVQGDLRIFIPLQNITNKVATIKTIRSLTGLCLRDAKNIVDSSGNQTLKIQAGVTESQLAVFNETLRKHNVTIY